MLFRSGTTALEKIAFTWDGPVLIEQANERPGEPLRTTTWDYEPGSFTPLAQTERTGLRDAPQADVDQRFYAIITDLIGTPSELIGPGGDLAGHQLHTLWGTTTWVTRGASTPLRFPGQYADPETGLHYNNHRYYDPTTGAYLTPDPLGLVPAPNPHAYVPNPTVLTDPLGLMPCTKPVWMPGWRKIDIDMDHIMSGHYPEGARVSPLKDVFPSTMSSDSVENAIRSAYKNSEIIDRKSVV